MRMSTTFAQGMWTSHFCFAQLIPVTRKQWNFNKCLMNERSRRKNVKSSQTRAQKSKRRLRFQIGKKDTEEKRSMQKVAH